jgi:hypothetical protein
MSRLDDDLKAAFKRQEPSPDFTARLMAQINEAPVPQPRLTLWQRLSGVFAIPALRWATVGAMALLLIIIGLAQLRSHRGSSVPIAPQIAETTEKPDTASEQPGTNHTTDTTQTLAKGPTVPIPSVQPDGRPRSIRHHVREARVEARQAQPSAEAEAAKEKILFALQITSSTLNEVQRAIADDTREDHPEPVQNR